MYSCSGEKGRSRLTDERSNKKNERSNTKERMKAKKIKERTNGRTNETIISRMNE